MKNLNKINHQFVEYIPKKLEDGIIYISIPFSIAVHKCCCGCGNEVVTPFSPTDWELIYNGEYISLDPSIGNWNFECNSHYWIKSNNVIWVRKWSKEEIEEGRRNDKLTKEKYFKDTSSTFKNKKNNFLQKIKRWL